LDNSWQTAVPAPETEEEDAADGPVDDERSVDDEGNDEPRAELELPDDIDNRKERPALQRLGAACGIAAVIAILASAFIVAQPPKADASAAKILTYYVEHRRMLLFSQWLAGLGAALFLWFVGSLWGTWARSHDEGAELSTVTLAGGIALASISLVGTGLNLTLAYLARQIQNSLDLVRTLYAAQFLTFTIVFFAAAVFLAGGGLLVRRLGARSLGLAGVVLAIFDVFAAAAISDFHGMRSPTGPLTLAAFFGLMAWVLLTSIAMLRGLGRPTQTEFVD
jgi:hypothetical protein